MNYRKRGGEKDTKKFIFLVLMFCFSLCPARFWEDERLVRVLAIQTGYTLNEGEWIVGIGPLAYGFTDRFMVRTNFLLPLIGVNVNLECKYAIIKETNTIPAIALGVGYVNDLWIQTQADIMAELYREDIESIKASLHICLVRLGVSKRLSSKLIGHSGFEIAIPKLIWDVKTKPGRTDPTSEVVKTLERMHFATNLIFGAEYEFSKKLRGLANIGFNFSHLNPIIGAGIIWAPGRTTRIELGLYYPLTPHISIYWRW